MTLTRIARIVGLVQYRAGEGPLLAIRTGRVEVAVTALDTTLSWTEGGYRGEAAMPIFDFLRYLSEGCIELEQGDDTQALRPP